MPEEMSEGRSEERILERVRLLLARADHPNTPAPEAELALERANMMMVKHAIDEAILRSKQSESERKKPTSITISLGKDGVGEFWPMLRTILTEIARANRCSAVIGVGGGYNNEVFGFSEDVSWVEMLYTSIYFHFISKVNPKWDTAKDYDENVYNFKVAGYKWYDINNVSMRNGGPDARIMEESWTGMMRPTMKIKSSMITAYKRHAKKIGDNNLVATGSHDEFRRQFSESYKSTVCYRLRRQAREASNEAERSEGGVVALRDVTQAVNEALWARYPHLSPEGQEKAVERVRASQERERKEREDMLNAMTEHQRAVFLEKEERQARAQAKRNERYWNRRGPAYQSSANLRGESAGSEVNISRNNGSVRNNNRKELG